MSCGRHFSGLTFLYVLGVAILNGVLAQETSTDSTEPEAPTHAPLPPYEPCAFTDVNLQRANVTTGAFGFSVRYPSALNNSNYNISVLRILNDDEFEVMDDFLKNHTEYKILIYRLQPRSTYNICIVPYEVGVTTDNATECQTYCFSGKTGKEYSYEQRNTAIAVLVTMVIVTVLTLGSDIAYDVLYKTEIVFYGVPEVANEAPSNTAFELMEQQLKITEAKKEVMLQSVYRKDGTGKDPRPLVVKLTSGREARMVFKAAKLSPYAKLSGNKIILTNN